VARAREVDHVGVVLVDDPVQVDVEQIQTRRGTPVAEQSRLDVLRLQGLAQQRVLLEIDLRDRQVVGRAPVAMDLGELVVRARAEVVGTRPLSVDDARNRGVELKHVRFLHG
jgi:hypothetical protein